MMRFVTCSNSAPALFTATHAVVQENIPIGLIIAYADLFAMVFITSSNALKQQATLHIIAMLLFAFGRVAHTVSYTLKNQPLQSVSYAVALTGIVLMGINGFIASLRATEDF